MQKKHSKFWNAISVPLFCCAQAQQECSDFSVSSLLCTGRKEQKMKFDQELFGRRIQEARMRRGITQEAFAEEIDISISYYQKLERGARSCSLDILVLIAEHLHVTTDYLLTGKKAQADEIKAALRASSHLLEELAAKI